MRVGPASGRPAAKLWEARLRRISGGAAHTRLSTSPALPAGSVSLHVSLLSISRQLSWAGLLNGLVGIREA